MQIPQLPLERSSISQYVGSLKVDIDDCHNLNNVVDARSECSPKRQKQSTAGIRWWSPTQLLTSRHEA